MTVTGLVPGAPLSDREYQVINLVARGLTNKEIADHLYLTPNTVKSHLARISCKTGVKGRAGLVAFAGPGKQMQIRTSAEVVEVLLKLRAERAARLPQIFSTGYYQQQGELFVLDQLITQIGALK